VARVAHDSISGYHAPMRRRLSKIYEVTVALLAWALTLACLLLSLTKETYTPHEMPDRVRPYIHAIAFDFGEWTLEAVGQKIQQASLAPQAYLDEAARSQLVRDYFDRQAQLDQIQDALSKIYADPKVADPAAASLDLRTREAEVRAQLDELRPTAEAILQEQISVILAEQGLAFGGQPFPPVSFHFTPLPLALIASPRDKIEQVLNVDVDGGLTLDEQVELENRVADGLEVSTLIVPLGGIGTYPAMVAQSRDLNWIASVTAHEWVHNYLTLRPLGLNYETTPELRTMNETTAEMLGDEIGALVIERYYPELAPPPAPFHNLLPRTLPPEEQAASPGFDFRAEMRTTRVTVDALLAEGRIDEAEAYMEQRRQFFWDNGYRIRKLNQAYFAFYGAYAESGGGAAGFDPVGPAVRLLRFRSPSIAAFLDTMAGFTSFEQLEGYVGLK
jgi:hypothetical protein